LPPPSRTQSLQHGIFTYKHLSHPRTQCFTSPSLFQKLPISRHPLSHHSLANMMLLFLTLPLLFALTSALPPCTTTHIFLAKGNNEPYPGRQGVLVDAICNGLTSCDYEDILFYNPVESSYCDSVSEAAVNGIAQITAYNKRCPDSNLVMSGYSQGAQVVGDILGGGGGVFFQGCVQKVNAGLDPDVAPGNKSMPRLTLSQNHIQKRC